MNTPSNPVTESPVTECALQLDRFARENPARALLIALGVGLAAGVLVRALQPRPAENRAARLLADLQERLHNIAAPLHRQAEDLVESGAGTVRNGVAQFHDLHLNRGLRKLGRRFKNLFN